MQSKNSEVDLEQLEKLLNNPDVVSMLRFLAKTMNQKEFKNTAMLMALIA